MPGGAGRREPPILVAVGGPMASGKSTLARRLGEALGAVVVSADDVRGELAHDGRPEAYLPGFSAELYPELLRRAAALLETGRDVVVDATFRTRALRADAVALATRCGARFRFVECRAEPALCRERLARRERERGERGWVEMFEHFLRRWEPVQELPPELHLVVDGAEPVDGSLQSVLSRLRC